MFQNLGVSWEMGNEQCLLLHSNLDKKLGWAMSPPHQVLSHHKIKNSTDGDECRGQVDLAYSYTVLPFTKSMKNKKESMSP